MPSTSPSEEKHPQEVSIPLTSVLTIAKIKTMFNKISKMPHSFSKTPIKNNNPSTISEETIKDAKGINRE